MTFFLLFSVDLIMFIMRKIKNKYNRQGVIEKICSKINTNQTYRLVEMSL